MTDWNMGSYKPPGVKLMVGSNAGGGGSIGGSMNPMAAAAVFYTRPSMSGLEVDHTKSPTMREGLLYAAAGFEVSSDQESLDVEASELQEHQHVEKKRRLSGEQVRSLEQSFEIENKLEPERKKQLAHELGLQPRQVAVWFQNRRARWKTKQLERDYDALKANYDALLSQNKKLQTEVMSLTAKLEAKSSHASNEAAADLENGKAVFDMDVECAATAGTSAVVVPAATAVARKAATAAAAAAVAGCGKIRAAKADKEGSPCSDGYTSEILDAECSEAVPVVGENVLPFEQQTASVTATATAAAPATMFQQEETMDGIVYDPHQFVMVPYIFEDPAGLLSHDCYLADDQIPTWWS